MIHLLLLKRSLLSLLTLSSTYESISVYSLFTGDTNYFTTSTQNGPLEALASGTGGVNGVYKYGSAGAFPTSSWKNSNYWVDVVFVK
ncbi:MAG: DUF4082 domain-containing protein [Candidatus Blackburnbacteria bacterium]|nr:DUF4082 domain-containing protein [Candidatus Blackburnbacteria bacterium]